MRSLGPVFRLPATVARARHRRRRPAGFAVALLLALAVVAPAAGAPPAGSVPRGQPAAPAIPRAQPPDGEPSLLAVPGSTSLVSPTPNGGFANGPSTAPSISENGRWVAFASLANNLVGNDTNNAQDVFVRDRREGTTIRLPLEDGVFVPAGGTALEPAISADGSAVAFTFRPPAGLTAVGTCDVSRVLLWRRSTGVTTLVGLDPDNEQACAATSPSVSADGSRIAFVSLRSNAAGQPLNQVSVRDLSSNATLLASVAPNGAVGNSHSRAPSISSDGSTVAFESDAPNLVQGGDPNELTDIYATELATSRVERISVAPGAQTNGHSQAPAISFNGAIVAFESDATNLIPGVALKARNVYAYNRT